MTNGNDRANTVAVSWSDEAQNFLVPDGGITKREYFAAMAMQGLVSTQNSDYGYCDGYRILLDKDGKLQYDDDGEVIREITETSYQKYAKESVAFADALIDALNQEAK